MKNPNCGNWTLTTNILSAMYSYPFIAFFSRRSKNMVTVRGNSTNRKISVKLITSNGTFGMMMWSVSGFPIDSSGSKCNVLFGMYVIVWLALNVLLVFSSSSLQYASRIMHANTYMYKTRYWYR